MISETEAGDESALALSGGAGKEGRRLVALRRVAPAHEACILFCAPQGEETSPLLGVPLDYTSTPKTPNPRRRRSGDLAEGADWIRETCLVVLLKQGLDVAGVGIAEINDIAAG